MYTVTPSSGKYLVTDFGSEGVLVFTVKRDRTCNCGHPGCPHVQAVRNYLANGGQRATDDDKPAPPIEQCPVCGAVVVPFGTIWRCIDDAAHYWQWRGEVSGIREFLTDPDHPAKIVRPFYWPDRYKWLEALEERNMHIMNDEILRYVKECGGKVSITAVADQFAIFPETVKLIVNRDERLELEDDDVKVRDQ